MASTDVVNPEILDITREILGDTNPARQLFTDSRLIEALRIHRKIVRMRDPVVKATGLVTTFPYRVRGQCLPEDNTRDSQLMAEPGGVHFQAQQHLRYWDPDVTPEVWVNSSQVTTGFTVDYISGRIAFDTAVDDWKPVQASFAHYQVYHAARHCLLGMSAAAGQVIRTTIAGDETEYGNPKDAIAALDAFIASISPKSIRWKRRIY